MTKSFKGQDYHIADSISSPEHKATTEGQRKEIVKKVRRLIERNKKIHKDVSDRLKTDPSQ